MSMVFCGCVGLFLEANKSGEADIMNNIIAFKIHTETLSFIFIYCWYTSEM